MLEKIFTKSIKRTPIGAATGYFGGQIDAYNEMIKEMEQHDTAVDYYRQKKGE